MRSRLFAAIALSALIAFGSLGLAACGGGSDEQEAPAAQEQAETQQPAAAPDADADEQDNCYGDDLPVTNE